MYCLIAGLWGVLNNAGIGGNGGPAEWLTKADYEEVFNVNLHGLIDVTVTFLPLVKQAKGRVVNTASIAGRISLPFCAPYAISKYGVEAFSDSIRQGMYRYIQVSECRAVPMPITSDQMRKHYKYMYIIRITFLNLFNSLVINSQYM